MGSWSCLKAQTHVLDDFHSRRLGFDRYGLTDTNTDTDMVIPIYSKPIPITIPIIPSRIYIKPIPISG
jgi:hypothetical protein